MILEIINNFSIGTMLTAQLVWCFDLEHQPVCRLTYALKS